MISIRLAAPWLMALLLGALCAIGFAPFAVTLAPTFSLAGLFLLLRRASSVRNAASLGLAWGAGCFLVGVSWVYISLAQFSGMAAPLAAVATLLFCLYLAGYPALAGALFFRWQPKGTNDIWQAALLFAGLWTLSEWLRGTLISGFPWLSVGYSQGPPSPLAGYAAVLGVYGIGLISALIGALLAAGWRSTFAIVGIVVLVATGGLLRSMEWTQPSGQPLRINLLQGNIAQDVKWDPARLKLSIERYIELAGQKSAPLTVLPETALPLFFHEVPREVLSTLTRHGDAVVGVAVATSEGGYTNGAVAISPQLQVQAYAKQHLVPFGEYVPTGFDWFFRFARIPLSGFTAGSTGQLPLTIGDQRIAPNICYEDLFGEELLATLSSATLLMNLSNTAWFGDSLAQPQHLQISQMRALETGRVMLRATNTGMTAMILPDGQVAATLPAFTSGVLTVEAQGYSGLTPYAKWGNLLALVLAAGACIPALRAKIIKACSRADQ
jgi:apolipoprotein N-acyltransferase